MIQHVLTLAGNLTHYAEIGLVIFLVVFLGICLRTFRRPRTEMDALAHLPIADENVSPAHAPDRTAPQSESCP